MSNIFSYYVKLNANYGYKNWNSLREALRELDHHTPYLVMRNYENLSEQCYYMDGHNDIDFLVQDIWKAMEVLHVHDNINWGSPNHFSITIQGRKVKIGLRYVGDGYYDTKWQEVMLQKRKLFKDDFYIMDDENYFYSLLYHMLLQKKDPLLDYIERLDKMKDKFIGYEPSDYDELLFSFLSKHNYVVPYPYDPSVIVNFHNVPKHIQKGYASWIKRKTLWQCFRFIYRVKWKFWGRISNE